MERYNPTIAMQALSRGATLVDVREPNELEFMRYDYETLDIPLGELATRSGELPTDRLLVLACQGGWRSEQAASLLESQGYRTANLEGGILAWERAGLPVKHGEPSVIAQSCGCGDGCSDGCCDTTPITLELAATSISCCAGGNCAPSGDSVSEGAFETRNA